jgi:hypothetical protein
MKDSSNGFEELVIKAQSSNKSVRLGWDKDAEAIARDGSDTSLIDHFPNLDDHNLDW